MTHRIGIPLHANRSIRKVGTMITVTAPLWLWSGEEGRWHFVTIPAEEALEIRLESAASGMRRGFGSVRVEATIQGVAWKTSIFPGKSGGYLLPVKASVRRDAGIAADDMVTVTIELL
jgi:hypothetical protein